MWNHKWFTWAPAWDSTTDHTDGYGYILRMLRPGDYELIGQRKGYQEVRKPLQIRAGAPPIKLHVACVTPE